MYFNVFICTSLYLLWILITLLLCGDIEVNTFEHSVTSDDSVGSIPTSLDLILESSTSSMHLNVQSLNKNKRDIIQAELGGFDILNLNETWSSQDTLLYGFQEPCRRDREEKRYGG